MDNQNSELPDLDYYLGERRRNIVTYEDGAKIMKNPFYSFVRIAKEAKANYLAKKQVL